MDGLCRTCTAALGTDNPAISVFSETDMGVTITTLLEEYCCLEITQNDRLPKEICSPCFNELTTVINFRRKCVNSEQSLLKLANESDREAIDNKLDNAKSPIFVDVLEKDVEASCSAPLTCQAEEEDQYADCYSMIEMVSFRCCLCSGILYSQEDHRDHIEQAHSVTFPSDTSRFDMNVECFICSKTFDGLEQLKAHQGKSYKEFFQCNNCEEMYETVEHVVTHFETHALVLEEEHKTNEVRKSIPNASQRNPKRSIRPKERYCCFTHCHDVFSDETQLIAHAREKHAQKLKYNQERNDMSSKPYVCEICFRSFGSAKNLKVHQFIRANNVDGKHFSCAHCPFRTVSRSLLTVHDRSKHSGERPFNCSHCEKRFFSEMHLKNHLICHSEERPFSCQFCERSFSRKRNMEEHIRSCHSEEKPFKCDECPARFKVPQHLRIHARIHSGEKPYKCSFCDNSYYHISDRKRHEMSHTGEKPHKCVICKAAFTRKRTLTIHERTHSGERPYCCTICGKGFCQNATLKKHMERHGESDIIVTFEIDDDPGVFYVDPVTN